MSNKAEKTGGLYSNASDYFQKGKSPSLDTDKQNYAGDLQDGYSYVAHQDSPDPVAFTQSKIARKGGGFDYGEKKYIYKRVEPKEAPAQQAPTTEPKAPVPEPKAETIVEPSPEIKQAKERVKNYEASIDGSQGSLFSTDEPQATEAEPDAQGFADKYKLNLLNKGAGQMDFSGV